MYTLCSVLYNDTINQMNAKIGKDNIGKHSLHMEYSHNGLRLLNLATCHNIMNGGTLFNNKNIHKGIWTFPDGLTINQIDHILIDKRHRLNLLDTKVYRRANIDSDHFLLVGRLRAKISSTRNEKGRRSYAIIPKKLKLRMLKHFLGVGRMR